MMAHTNNQNRPFALVLLAAVLAISPRVSAVLSNQNTMTVGVSAFTTAAKNGESPATSGQTTGPLYVRERADNESPERPELQVQAFMTFDLSSLAGLDVASAVLMMHETNKLNNVNSADMFIARVVEAWNTSGMLPVYGEPSVDGLESAGPDGTDVADTAFFGNNGPASAGPVVSIDHQFDMTAWVTQWLADPSSNHGVRLHMEDAFAGATFFDSAGPDAPRLVVTFAVPEPATTLLVPLGLAALAVRSPRRRHAAA